MTKSIVMLLTGFGLLSLGGCLPAASGQVQTGIMEGPSDPSSTPPSTSPPSAACVDPGSCSTAANPDMASPPDAASPCPTGQAIVYQYSATSTSTNAFASGVTQGPGGASMTSSCQAAPCSGGQVGVEIPTTAYVVDGHGNMTGLPLARVFVGFTFEPTVGDRDHDGIKDDVDKCPDEPETYNGFQDGDGCPDELPPPPVQKTPEPEYEPEPEIDTESPLPEEKPRRIKRDHGRITTFERGREHAERIVVVDRSLVDRRRRRVVRVHAAEDEQVRSEYADARVRARVREAHGRKQREGPEVRARRQARARDDRRRSPERHGGDEPADVRRRRDEVEIARSPNGDRKVTGTVMWRFTPLLS